MKTQGIFVVIDGIDGCGKSTQAQKIKEELEREGRSVHRTAEPSSGEIGQILRKYLKDDSVPAAIDALLFAADRVDHCHQTIIPALAKGQIIISDRYRDSSYVYQSIQGKDVGIDLEWVKCLNKFSLAPDLVFILDLDPKIALARRQAHNAANQEELEKFEQLAFQEQIRKVFLKLAHENITEKQKLHYLPNPSTKIPDYYILDATLPIDKITEKILTLIHKALENVEVGIDQIGKDRTDEKYKTDGID